MALGQPPFLKIVNEPESKFRFRYASEAGSHGGILGKEKEISGKKCKKTYPTVKLVNYHGKNLVFIRVSLYTEEKEKHVLELKGKNVKNGMCYQNLDSSFEAKFNGLVIVNKKKDEVHEILMKRKISSLGHSITGAAKKELEKEFSQEIKNKAKEILSSVLLCFEAFLEGNERAPICDPIFSEPVFNQRSSLRIVRLSHVSGTWRGNDEVILLCDKVKKGSVKVLFFENSTECEENLWEGNAVFSPTDIHHQVAIAFRTPRYKQNIEKSVSVCLCQDDDKSECVTFKYLPDDYDEMMPYKKRKRPVEEEMKDVLNNIMATPSPSNSDSSLPFQDENIVVDYNCLNSLNFTVLQKLEDDRNENSQDVIFKNNLWTQLESVEDIFPLPDPVIDDPISQFDLLSSSFEGDDLLFQPDIINHCLEPYEMDSSSGTDVVGQMGSALRNENSLDLHNGEDLCVKTGFKHNKNWNIDKPWRQKYKGLYSKFLSNSDAKTTGEQKPQYRKLSKPETQEKWLEKLHWRDKLNNTLLHWAVFHNKNAKLFLIMDARLRTNILNVQNHYKQTALHIAVEKKNKPLVQLLLHCDADPNLKDVNGNNCLHVAAKNEFHEGLFEIIRSPRFLGINDFNNEGLTAVHLSAIHRSNLCFYPLIMEANLNALNQKNGKSVLHFAIEMLPYQDVAHLLAQNRADVNSQDFSGNTPLHLACAIGNLKLVKLLLENFADPSLRNFKQVLETSDIDIDANSYIVDASIEEMSSKEMIEGQLPMDLATDPTIVEVLKNAVQRKKEADSHQSKCLSEFKSMTDLCISLDKELNTTDWKVVLECMGLDEFNLDTMLVCSDQSMSKAVLNYLKRKQEDDVITVLENLFEIANLDKAVKLVRKHR